MLQYSFPPIGESLSNLRAAVEDRRRLEEATQDELNEIEEALKRENEAKDRNDDLKRNYDTEISYFEAVATQKKDELETLTKQIEDAQKTYDKLAPNRDKLGADELQRKLEHQRYLVNKYGAQMIDTEKAYTVSRGKLSDYKREAKKLDEQMTEIKNTIALLKIKQKNTVSAHKNMGKLVSAAEKALEKKKAEIQKAATASQSKGIKRGAATPPAPAKRVPIRDAKPMPYADNAGLYQTKYDRIMATSNDSAQPVTAARMIVASAHIYSANGTWLWLPEMVNNLSPADQSRIFNDVLLAFSRVAYDESSSPSVRKQAINYGQALQVWFNNMQQTIFLAPDADLAPQTRRWRITSDGGQGLVLEPENVQNVPWAQYETSMNGLASRLVDAVLQDL